MALTRVARLARRSGVAPLGARGLAGASSRPRVVVAGAGVAGCSTALQLARRGADVVLVDPRPPLTATSQYSTECYRNFFLDEALVPFMSRSVDLLEELAGEENPFQMNRRGYVFLTATDAGARALEAFAQRASSYGAGEVRTHRDSIAKYARSPPNDYRHPGMDGFDLLYGSCIREAFPFVSEDAVAMLHARRCGWMDAQGLGMRMLNEAKEGAPGFAQVVRGSIAGFDVLDEEVRTVRVQLSDGGEEALSCDHFVNCAGAWMQNVGSLLAPNASKLPLENEIHAKVILDDTANVIPQDEAPFMVWRDRTQLPWDEEEKEALVEFDDTDIGGIVNSRAWIGPQPGGHHLRPAGNGRVLLLWEHLHRHVPCGAEPQMPVAEEHKLDCYPQLCVAGLQAMVPGLAVYGSEEGAMGKGTTIDAGYYTVTPDGRPLIGQHGPSYPKNSFMCGGMGTYGLMGSPVAGELAAKHVLGEELPDYAAACVWPRLSAAPRPVDLLDDSA